MRRVCIPKPLRSAAQHTTCFTIQSNSSSQEGRGPATSLVSEADKTLPGRCGHMPPARQHRLIRPRMVGARRHSPASGENLSAQHRTWGGAFWDMLSFESGCPGLEYHQLYLHTELRGLPEVDALRDWQCASSAGDLAWEERERDVPFQMRHECISAAVGRRVVFYCQAIGRMPRQDCNLYRGHQNGAACLFSWGKAECQAGKWA